MVVMARLSLSQNANGFFSCALTYWLAWFLVSGETSFCWLLLQKAVARWRCPVQLPGVHRCACLVLVSTAAGEDVVWTPWRRWMG